MGSLKYRTIVRAVVCDANDLVCKIRLEDTMTLRREWVRDTMRMTGLERLRHMIYDEARSWSA